MYAITFDLEDVYGYSTEDQIKQFAQEYGCVADLLDEDCDLFLFTSESYACLEEFAIRVLDTDVSDLIVAI
jgi:peptidoglycan hydrolase-like protein with peptidoglycan-binding domain